LFLIKDNIPRLIENESSNSSIITSALNPLIKLISTFNRSSSLTNRHQVIQFNSISQFSNSLIYSILPYDNEQIRSWHLKVNLISSLSKEILIFIYSRLI
jgi:hypothetical protein